jgi:hypothetical protein
MKAQIQKKTETGGATGPFFTAWMKKTAARGLAGTMAGDAF